MSALGARLPRPIAAAFFAAAALLLLPAAPTLASKNYQLFRLDTSFHFAYTYGPGRYGGGLFLEPKFTVLDQLAVGLQTGVSLFGGGSLNPNSGSVSMSMGAVLPFLAKAEWYFIDAPVRPFVGFALGGYDIISQTVGMGVDQRVGFFFGLTPEAGIELGWFRLSVSYHAIIASGIRVQQTLGSPETFDVSQNYLTFNIGFRRWGRRRPPPPPLPPPVPAAPLPAAAAHDLAKHGLVRLAGPILRR